MADADDVPAERRAAPHDIQRTFDLPHQLSPHRELFPARAGRQSVAARAIKSTGFQSLKRLADGENDTLAAIDGSTVYRGWGDLVATLRKIMDFERGNAGTVQLNVAETDARINPGDHSDHLMTAKAALDAVKDLACVRRVYYVDYASSRLPENLDRTPARHGKLGVCRDACRRAGAGPPGIVASLR